MAKDRQRAVIIGAGPAGLTAAYELLARTDIQPVVIEKSEFMGGISRTVNYKGNRIDIGGHRFFSNSARVVDWWLQMLPLQSADEETDQVMLLRRRKSRIYYLHRLFEYPVSLSRDILQLGLWRAVKIGASYLRSVLLPIKEERNLEQFFINRFGRELYRTFFKSYTEKVWGVPCHRISAEWGAQRIRSLSAASTLLRNWKNKGENSGPHVRETSLIDQFLYPKFGPGQLWEEVARRVIERGGEIRTGWQLRKIHTNEWRVKALEAKEVSTGETAVFEGDYFFSSAPVKELMRSFDVHPPANVLEVSDGLLYRDFIMVGLLVTSLLIDEETPRGRKLISDNWIYIQEPGVQLGRLQIFNNWSPGMVADPANVWLGLEYFCDQSDAIWKFSDADMASLAREELSRIGIIDPGKVLDSTVIRMEKTYPAYFGAYERFGEIRRHVDRYENLFLIGRNGMHRYNNQDHSMLTAMVAVDKIIDGSTDKSSLWEVDTGRFSARRD